jgi:hypothetical protein
MINQLNDDRSVMRGLLSFAVVRSLGSIQQPKH